MGKKIGWVIWGLSATFLSVPALGSVLKSSLGADGINALKLHQAPYNLQGRKIAIGQVEIGRPGMFGWDKTVSENRDLSMAAVFARNKIANSNTDVDPHAYSVASVMVSRNKALPGVAPEARLYSSAVGFTKNVGQAEECISTQHVALQNGGDVRAINFSFGEPLSRDSRTDPVLDGNALLTLCIDWSSRVHNVLYVVAGNQGRGGIPIPTDNFNGVNVAFSSRIEGVFNKLDVANLASEYRGAGNRLAGKEFNIDGRRSIGLVAPGSNISTLDPKGNIRSMTGTSFAAPQVTATIALLQEFGDQQIRRGVDNWSTDARAHEVMKAVLLNSADKVKDEGDGLRLGMSRTLLDKQNQNWLASDAYQNPLIPLDAQMGAGHLNVFRAYQQFSSGQWRASKAVPTIGWDYGNVNVNTTVDYVLAQPLKQGSFISATLSWSRLVELNDTNNNDLYDVGETFRDRGLNNLNLYLVKLDAKTGETATVCSSTSRIDSVEHIFCPVPSTGNYKIRVQFPQSVHKSTQAYGLAWWGVSPSPSSP